MSRKRSFKNVRRWIKRSLLNNSDDSECDYSSDSDKALTSTKFSSTGNLSIRLTQPLRNSTSEPKLNTKSSINLKQKHLNYTGCYTPSDHLSKTSSVFSITTAINSDFNPKITTENMAAVSEILKDIDRFTGRLSDVNKFISSVRASYEFVDTTSDINIRRYVNGVKNKLDGATFNTLSQTTFTTLNEFISAFEAIFLTSNDPSTTQIELVNRKQKPEENIMTFSNKMLELNNEYLTLYKAKFPETDQAVVAISSELLLTQSFIANLKHPFCKYARGHFFTSFIDAKKWALDVEKTERPSDNRGQSNPQKPNDSGNNNGRNNNYGNNQNRGQGQNGDKNYNGQRRNFPQNSNSGFNQNSEFNANWNSGFNQNQNQRAQGYSQPRNALPNQQQYSGGQNNQRYNNNNQNFGSNQNQNRNQYNNNNQNGGFNSNQNRWQNNPNQDNAYFNQNQNQGQPNQQPHWHASQNAEQSQNGHFYVHTNNKNNKDINDLKQKN